MWLWKEKVSKGISEKIRFWKLRKAGGSKDKDLDAKLKVQHVVYIAKRNAEIEKVTSVAREMRTKNQDVIREKCIRGDDDNISLDNASKKLAWKQHHKGLLNIEFPWS